MDLSATLASHLRNLVDSFGTGDDGLGDAVAALVGDLRRAVSSYHGLRLTLVLDEWPVTMTAFPGIDGQRPATSLRMALSALGGGFDEESHIVFYAGTPGAFVDLAADLAYLHRLGQPVGPNGHRPAVALDLDLPPVSVITGFSGLTEYATINKAVGILIDRGHTPGQAHIVLRGAAKANGHTLPEAAATVLEE